MKKNICYVIVLIFISIGCGDSKKKEFYPNGNIKSEFSLSNGVFNGNYKIFYESGELKESGYYSNGIKIDTTIKFHKSGIIAESNVFETRNLYRLTKYDSLGNVYVEGKISNNDSIGWWNFYYPNGNLKLKKEFWLVKDNIIVNQYIYYDQKGNIDFKKSNYIQISKNKDIIEYRSPYENLYLGEDRFLWAIIIDSTSKAIYDDLTIDTLYPFNETSFFVESQKYYKGFIQERILIDTIVDGKKKTLVRELNTFFNKENNDPE